MKKSAETSERDENFDRVKFDGVMRQLLRAKPKPRAVAKKAKAKPKSATTRK